MLNFLILKVGSNFMLGMGHVPVQIGVQVQGYALLSTCYNFKQNHDIVHVLAQVAMQRLKQQEKALGGYYNDW